MNQHTAFARGLIAPGDKQDQGLLKGKARINAGGWALLLGAAALAAPTMVSIARFSWSTEQGGHGPIVLAIGIWLLGRERARAVGYARPGSPWLFAPAMLAFLAAYLVAHITDLLEIEGFAMYGALLTAAYAVWGGRVLRILWFPLLYLAFVFPPPDSWVAAITQPIKIVISEAAVSLLYALGYPVASTGVTIQIAQYNLLIAAACAGLNSIISLTAICLFYIYMRHNANYRYFLLLLAAIIPVAVFANFVRVILLILITYYFGDAVAQGFVHDFAGLLMFSVSLLAMFAIDWLAGPIRRRLGEAE